MKLISWNVNGIRACVTKGFLEYFSEMDADIFCLQEIKMQQGQIELDLKGYHQYFNYILLFHFLFLFLKIRVHFILSFLFFPFFILRKKEGKNTCFLRISPAFSSSLILESLSASILFSSSIFLPGAPDLLLRLRASIISSCR